MDLSLLLLNISLKVTSCKFRYELSLASKSIKISALASMNLSLTVKPHFKLSFDIMVLEPYMHIKFATLRDKHALGSCICNMEP